MRQYFKEEAAVVNDYMKGVHHTKKDRYMQVFYASTVDKLTDYKKAEVQQKFKGGASSYLNHLYDRKININHRILDTSRAEPTPVAAIPPQQSIKDQKYSEFVQTINGNVKAEFERNDRRLRYNTGVYVK
jgi:hypothetical protein